MATADSPFAQALIALARGRVEFVVVGVGGINFYALDPSTAFVTQDLDVWVRPAVATLRGALRALASVGFQFEAGGEPFVDVDDELVLGNVIAMTSNLVARGPLDSRIDVMLAMEGFDFEKTLADAAAFVIGGESLRVARLETILEAKERAGREKDRAFLAAFRARRDEFLPGLAKPKKRRIDPAKRRKRPK